LEFPPWLEDARKLAPFSATTWKAWADIAWRVIAELSPDGKPENHPGFYDPATKICNVKKTRKNPYFGKQENAPSIARTDIKEAVFDGFENIATGMSSRTRRRKKAAAKARKPA
jgi:hypothetical protein